MKSIRARLRDAVGPFSVAEGGKGEPRYFPSDRFRNLLFRGKSHVTAFLKTPHRWTFAKNFLLTTYAPWLPRKAPPELVIEFTNYCNLRCVYCPNPLGLRPRGLMSDETFSALLRSLEATRITRLHISGNGEPTLHPKFPFFVAELRRRAQIVDITTNGHWSARGTLDSLLSLDRVDVSVDGGDRDRYMDSRRLGNFELVRANLSALGRRKRESGSKTLVYIRLMLRPSDMARKAELIAAWQGFADVVSPCPVFQVEPLQPVDDVFSVGRAGSMPTCRRRFSWMVVAWDGTVPLCGPALFKPPHPHNVLGDVRTSSLTEMFNGQLLRQYRRAHRQRVVEDMPVCRNCTMAS